MAVASAGPITAVLTTPEAAVATAVLAHRELGNWPRLFHGPFRARERSAYQAAVHGTFFDGR